MRNCPGDPERAGTRRPDARRRDQEAQGREEHPDRQGAADGGNPRRERANGEEQRDGDLDDAKHGPALPTPPPLTAAIAAARAGHTVALAERNLTGGTCVNFGCTPSKALLRAARAVHQARDGEKFGYTLVAAPRVDFAALMTRVRERCAPSAAALTRWRWPPGRHRCVPRRRPLRRPRRGRGRWPAAALRQGPDRHGIAYPGLLEPKR